MNATIHKNDRGGWSITPPNSKREIGNFSTRGDAEKRAKSNGWHPKVLAVVDQYERPEPDAINVVSTSARLLCGVQVTISAPDIDALDKALKEVIPATQFNASLFQTTTIIERKEIK